MNVTTVVHYIKKSTFSECGTFVLLYKYFNIYFIFLVLRFWLMVIIALT